MSLGVFAVRSVSIPLRSAFDAGYAQSNPSARQEVRAIQRRHYLTHEERCFLTALGLRIGFPADNRPLTHVPRAGMAYDLGLDPERPADQMRVSALWGRFARLGILERQIDKSLCPRDEAGNIISHQGTRVWLRFIKVPPEMPLPGRPKTEPRPRVVYEKDMCCPKCGSSKVVDHHNYQCLGCWHHFTPKDAERARRGAEKAARKRAREKGWRVDPESGPGPEPPDSDSGPFPPIGEILSTPQPATPNRDHSTTAEPVSAPATPPSPVGPVPERSEGVALSEARGSCDGPRPERYTLAPGERRECLCPDVWQRLYITPKGSVYCEECGYIWQPAPAVPTAPANGLESGP